MWSDVEETWNVSTAKFVWRMEIETMMTVRTRCLLVWNAGTWTLSFTHSHWWCFVLHSKTHLVFMSLPLYSTPHPNPTAGGEVMVYSITLPDALPCYDNLLNTKLKCAICPRGWWTFCRMFCVSILKSCLFTFPSCRQSAAGANASALSNGDKWPVSTDVDSVTRTT